MQFFKRILQPAETKAVAPEKRAGGQRLVVAEGLPLRVGFAAGGAGRWNWKCRLLNCSEPGVRLQAGAEVTVTTGAPCHFILELEGFELVVPCLVSNQRRMDEKLFVGLRQVIADADTLGAYRQFLEVVALGATLRLNLRRYRPDGTEFLVEQYTSPRRSCLNVWRNFRTGLVVGAELILRDCLVRMAPGQSLEYYAGTEAAAGRQATPAQALEIHRLFRWVVPNLPLSVPEEVRKFLLKAAV
jgi:hypothetical protein